MKDRVKKLEWVSPLFLRPDTRNWRTHPAAQRRVFQAMRERLGNLDPVIVRIDENGDMVVVNGHLRVSTAIENDESKIPVVILDVDEYEAGIILATLDPISEMAEVDTDKMITLRGDLKDTWEQAFAGIEETTEKVFIENERVDTAVSDDVRRGIIEQEDSYLTKTAEDAEIVVCPHCANRFWARVE